MTAPFSDNFSPLQKFRSLEIPFAKKSRFAATRLGGGGCKLVGRVVKHDTKYKKHLSCCTSFNTTYNLYKCPICVL